MRGRAIIRGIMAAILVGGLIGGVRVRAQLANAQSDWVVESSIGTNVTIDDAAFTDENNGWAVGEGIYVTHDGGKTWGVVNVQVHGELRHIVLPDATHGVIVGDGDLLGTNDGGVTWQHIVSQTLPTNMTGIAHPSPNTTFVSTNGQYGGGAIYESTDNGQTWDVAESYGQYGFTDVLFTDAQHGWAPHSWGGMFATSDGGQSWHSVTVDTHTSGAFAVSFPTGQEGFVAGLFNAGAYSATNGFYIARTTDGGLTWNEQTATTNGGVYADAAVHAIRFLNPAIGMISVADGIYATSDAGQTWSTQSLPALSGDSLAVAAYRGGTAFAMTRAGTFLHFGPLPLPATPTPTTPPATATPQAAPTQPLFVAFPTETPAPFSVQSISDSTVLAGSGVTLTVRGIGFDDQATVTIGSQDITDVSLDSAGGLAFKLPAGLAPGVYDVTVTEPDGRSATLPHALTITPVLRLSAKPLHPTVTAGDFFILQVQAGPATYLSARLLTANNHAAPHIKVFIERSTGGAWRVVVTPGATVAKGSYKLVLTAKYQGQTASTTVGFRVT